MCTKPHLKISKLLQFYLFLVVGVGLISCTPAQNEAKTTTPQAPEKSTPLEVSLTPLLPTSTIPMDTTPTEESLSVIPTAVPTPTVTKVITLPTLIHLEVPLETKKLPAYGWFSENSQIVNFSYPEEEVTFSYNIATQELTSTILLQKSSEELVAQIANDLPPNALVVEISPKYQNILFTVPVSQPTTLERGAFTVPLSNELWLYKAEGSIRLGVIDECFQLHLTHDILWSPSEDLATVFAVSPMACAWSNWLIDLETLSVGPLYPSWEEGAGLPGYYVTAILPNKQLLVNPLLRNKPSAVLDLQNQGLTTLTNRGNEITQYLDKIVILDFIFWPSSNRTEDETEIGFSPLNGSVRQLIGTIEGAIRAKYVSPDQKQVLLFSGSPDYYGLSENQKTTGVWLLSFP